MGCDIHLFTEAKRTIRNENVWVNIDNWKINPYYDGKEEGEREYEINELYKGRNYSLFTLLAGVRDYSRKTIPISDPKGLPEDMSPQIKKEADRWDSDGHTHSWFTLGELKRFQEKQPTVTHSGLISATQAKELDEDGKTPNSWCQGTNMEGYVRREWTEPDNSLNNIIQPLEERMKDFFWISKNDKDYDKKREEEVRIVFWFDN